MKTTKVCLDCGSDYEYDSDRALGASSIRCCNCRKKDSVNNKKIILFSTACNNGVMECRKCGYKKCANALVLADTKVPFSPANTQEKKEAFARSQYLLCLNCQEEIRSGQIEAAVINSECYPVDVEFFEREVVVVKKKVNSVKYSTDVIETEITTDSPESRDPIREAKRVGKFTAIDLPLLSNEYEARASELV